MQNNRLERKETAFLENLCFQCSKTIRERRAFPNVCAYVCMRTHVCGYAQTASKQLHRLPKFAPIAPHSLKSYMGVNPLMYPSLNLSEGR